MPLDDKDPNYLRLVALRYFYIFANYQVKRKPQLLVYDGSQSTQYDSNFFVDNEDYCAMPIAVSHILPSSKFIIVMRNPVERTFSHYKFYCTIRHSKPPPSSVFHERVVAHLNFLRECLSQNHSMYECVSDKQFATPKPPRTEGCGEVGYNLITSMYYLDTSRSGCSSSQEKTFSFSGWRTC